MPCPFFTSYSRTKHGQGKPSPYETILLQVRRVVLLFGTGSSARATFYGGQMLSQGPAKKVCIYVNEDTRHNLTPLYEAILSFLLHEGVSGATAYNALVGFGSHRVMHTAQVELLSEHLSIRIEFIEAPEKVDGLLPALCAMVTDGVIEVQDTTVVKTSLPPKKH